MKTTPTKFEMYHKRRKKRLSHGIKSLEISRGRNGYGFTISGQHPCVLSCIVAGSAAEAAGLRAGDVLLSVNNQDVSRAPHDDVVRLIGSSTGILLLQISENLNSSETESSDDEFLTRNKAKYQYKYRKPSSQRVDRVLNDVQSGAIFDHNEKAKKYRRRREDRMTSTPSRDSASTRTLPKKVASPECDDLAMCIVVGYIGSVDTPSESKQTVRGAVRRLRLEHRNYTLILMKIYSHGIKLMNNLGSTVAFYAADRLAYAGACPADQRYFGLVTISTRESGASSHVFMVDTELTPHPLHSMVAKNFRIVCTPDLETRSCLEFPLTANSVLCVVSNLYRQYCTPLFETETRGTRRSNSNTSSNSDGSFGRARKQQQQNVFVVDLESQQQQQQGCHHDRQVSSASSRSEGPECTSSPRTALRQERLDVQSSAGDIRRHMNRYFHHRNSENDVSNTNSDADSIQSDPMRSDIRSDPMRSDLRSDARRKSDTFRLSPRAYVNTRGGDDVAKDRVVAPPEPEPVPFKTVNRRQSDGVFTGFKKPSSKALRAAPKGQEKEPGLKSSLSHEHERYPWMNKQAYESQIEMAPPFDIEVKAFADDRFRKPRLRVQSLAKAVVDDDQLNRSVRMVPSSSMDSVADTSLRHQDLPTVESVAASWALGIDKLLSDGSGLAAFMAFLKKEFSEENLVFWIACEQYKKLKQHDQRSFRAQEIFNKHLSSRATDPVNVDSQARTSTQEALPDAQTDLFQLAQDQIFQLMKHDSYSRFIKSEIYKQCVVSEMEGGDLPYEPIEIHSENSSKTATLERKKKAKEDSADEKRKKSFLPWRLKSKKFASNKENDDQPVRKAIKSREESPKKSLSMHSSSSSLSKRSDDGRPVVVSQEDLRRDAEFRERLETVAPLKVILPDGSTASTVVSVGVTVRMAIRKICDRKSLPIIAVDVFQLGSDKVLDLDSDISQLGAKEIVIEKRTLFRLDFPNKKAIGVKAKPNRPVKDVLRPILIKYGYSLDSVHVHVNGSPVDLRGQVSSLDNQRVVVQTQEDYEEWGGFDPGSGDLGAKPPLPPRTPASSRNTGSLEEITNRVFDDLLTPGSVNKFDELGILDKDAPRESRKSSDQRSLARFNFRRRNSLGDKDKPHKSQRAKMSPTRSVTSRMSNINITDPDGEYFLDLLSKAQSNRIDDQRGLSSENFEIPDFLKPENSPAVVGPTSTSPLVIDNVTAKSAGSTPEMRHLVCADRSFSDDCVYPDHLAAERLFQQTIVDVYEDTDRTIVDVDTTRISISPPPLPISEYEVSISETPEANYPPPPGVPGRQAIPGARLSTSTPVRPRKPPPVADKPWKRTRPLDLTFTTTQEPSQDDLPSPSTHVLLVPNERYDRSPPDGNVRVTFV